MKSLVWTVDFSEEAAQALRKLDKPVAQRIQKFLYNRIATAEDPRILGIALQGERFDGLWRYRVGDYRLICDIKDQKLVVLVVDLGHRREVYR